MIRLALLASLLACRSPVPNEVPPLAPAPEPAPGGPPPAVPGVPDPNAPATPGPNPEASPKDGGVNGPVSMRSEFQSSAEQLQTKPDAGAAPKRTTDGGTAPIDAPAAPLPPVPDAPVDASRRE